MGSGRHRPIKNLRLSRGTTWFITRRGTLTHNSPTYFSLIRTQRLSGASLLVFANKTDVGGCMDEEEIQLVCRLTLSGRTTLNHIGTRFNGHQDS